MAVRPAFRGLKLTNIESTPHTLEIFLDYVCPYSAKLFNTFYSSVKPIIAQKYNSKLQVVFKQQIQPWHPSSTLVNEAGAAVLKVAPEKFWEFSDVLFKNQVSYFDEALVNELRNDTYKRLAALAASVGIDEKQIYDLLVINPGEGRNAGNGVTNDIKLQVRANRVIGVHVSPTVFFNGIEERNISSSFTTEQWEEWLIKNVV